MAIGRNAARLVTHPDHLLTKRLGRERFYEDYHLQVCEVVRESRFSRDPDAAS